MYSKIVLLLSLFFLLYLPVGDAQNLPNLRRAFQQDEVPRVDIYLPADSLAWILDPQNNQSNYHFHARFVFSDSEKKDTVENVGFRIRGNTSRSSKKKSFKVSFNTYASGRKWQGLEKMNINGEHNDPTISRAKIGWDILRELELVGSRANHVQLYINGAYFGVYANIEHIDEEFVELRFGNKNGNLYKCLWPADLAYEGSNPNIYKTLGSSSRQAYELMTNKAQNDYSDLAEFIDVLNNTSVGNRACALEKVFNVESFLKIYAFEILIGHWDNYAYNKNNFYLYKNTATGQFEYIPYDLDNTLGIDWLNRDWTTRGIYEWARTNHDRPLVRKILEVPRYRERFTIFMDDMLRGTFDLAEIFHKIDAVRQHVRPYVIDDTYRTLDYGFDLEDFDDSFEVGLGFSQTRWGIKEFLSLRVPVAFMQMDARIRRPILHPQINAEMTAYTRVGMKALLENPDAMVSAQVAFPSPNGTTFYDLNDDGLSNDAYENDGVFGALLPFTFDAPGQYNYYFQVLDNQGSMRRYPDCDFYTLTVREGQNAVFINEIMPKNTTTLSDDAGDFDDWIELYFPTNPSFDTDALYLTDDIAEPDKWKVPMDNYSAGYYLFWADNEESEGANHTNFKLDGDGEFIGLFEKMPNGDFRRQDGFYFGAQSDDVAYARLPNGNGPLNEALATPLANNQSLVAAAEPIPEQGWMLSPNPSTGIFILEAAYDWSRPAPQLFDAMGRAVSDFSYTIKSNYIQFDIKNCRLGYIMCASQILWKR